MYSNSLYRHGDVLVRHIASLPPGCQRKAGTTLAYGEVTGHSHRLEPASSIQLWKEGANLYLEVIAPSATLVHEEHRPIELPRGVYHVWRQREYRPDRYVEVQD